MKGPKDIPETKMKILAKESEDLYFCLEMMAQRKLPELCELIVTLSLQEILAIKNKRISDVDIDDFIEATQISIARVEDAAGFTWH